MREFTVQQLIDELIKLPKDYFVYGEWEDILVIVKGVRLSLPEDDHIYDGPERLTSFVVLNVGQH